MAIHSDLNTEIRLGAIERRLAALEQGQVFRLTEFNSPYNTEEECQKHVCTYYTRNPGLSSLGHEGFHAVERDQLTAELRLKDLFEANSIFDEGGRASLIYLSKLLWSQAREIRLSADEAGTIAIYGDDDERYRLARRIQAGKSAARDDASARPTSALPTSPDWARATGTPAGHDNAHDPTQP